jgi:hypothetical protein
VKNIFLIFLSALLRETPGQIYFRKKGREQVSRKNSTTSNFLFVY